MHSSRQLLIALCLTSIIKQVIPQAISNHADNINKNEEFEKRLATRSTQDERWSAQNLENVYDFYRNPNALGARQTVAELDMTTTVSGRQIASSQGIVHRYDDWKELLLASESGVNQLTCLSQLDNLVQRLERLDSQQLSSRDLNLYLLLSNYGSVQDFISTNQMKPGAYQQCLRSIIDTPEGKVPSRYCVASLRRTDWPKVTSDRVSIDVGVCLPSSCDSLNYRNKYNLVNRLVDFNSRKFETNKTELMNLYCLPDDISPLRAWWTQPMPLTVTIVLLVWISMIMYATLKHENRDHSKAPIEKDSANSTLLKSMSIDSNLRKLMRMRRPIPSETIDLGCIDGIKVISMLFIIANHYLVLEMHMIDNTRDLTSINPTSLAFKIISIIPSTVLDIFFMLSGLTTSYQLLKTEEAGKIYRNLKEWLRLIARRYLRLIPMLALTVLFNKYLFRFMGSGPFWDYGTSLLSRDKVCQQESWLWTLFSVSNFNKAVWNCNIVGWHISSEVQFLALTPIFLALLVRRPKLTSFGMLTLTHLMMVSQIIDIWGSEVQDLRIILDLMPATFSLVMNVFSREHTWPIFRGTSYILGILIGYSLFSYERYQECQKLDKTQADGRCILKFCSKHLKLIRKVALSTISILIIINLGRPYIIIMNLKNASLIVGTTWPLIHISQAFAVGLYIILSATGIGVRPIDKLLSKTLWTPLAKLSLATSLINMNVIILLLSTMQKGYSFNIQMLLPQLLFVYVLSYMVALAFHILFESPITELFKWTLPNIMKDPQS